VSHDRFFVSQTANKIWEIVDEQIKEFKGTYTEYLEWKERMAKRESDSKEPAVKNEKVAEIKKQAETKATVEQPATAELKQPINKELKKELQKQQKQLQQLEEKINQTTEEKNKTEQQLSDPNTYSDREKFVDTEAAYQKISKQLLQLNKEYELLFEKVMELESKV
jgi:ATP-binding cassette, subfamily F, member 3